MLLPFPGLLLLWVCSQTATSQLHGHQTKATFTYYESNTAEKNAQSRRWRTVTGEDRGGPQSASSQVPRLAAVNPEPSGPSMSRRAVRKSEAQSGVRRVRLGDGAEALRADINREVKLRVDGGWSGHRRSPKPSRTKRSEALQGGSAAPLEALPAAMAQEQEAGPPFGLNISDYEEEYSAPDFVDPTLLVPVDTRTRRKQVKNPFYPLTAESYGAYAVMIVAVIIFSVGIIGNVSVMCIVCHNYYMRSISNSLLANLALWDFVVIFFCLPLVVFHELTKNWLLGEFSCRIIPYLEVRVLGKPAASTSLIVHIYTKNLQLKSGPVRRGCGREAQAPLLSLVPPDTEKTWTLTRSKTTSVVHITFPSPRWLQPGEQQQQSEPAHIFILLFL